MLSDRSSQGLYIRQVSTANDKEIVAPAPVGFFGMTFSPDGNELFYAIKQSLDAGTLYRIPVLGGTPVKLLSAIDGPVSFSPDGQHFAFERGNFPSPGSSSLLIADIDGSDERTLAVQKLPNRFVPIFFTGPSWSSDNKIVAISVSAVGEPSRVVGFSVQDGTEKDLTSDRWPFTGRVQWLPDMSGLIVAAGESASLSQLWHIDYPSGKTRRITNDLGTYRSISLTADGRSFSTVQANGLLNLWIVPEGKSERAIRLPTGNIGFYGNTGSNVTWTPDGRIVFVSNEGSMPDIWITDPDGGNRKQLTSNGAANFTPVVTNDGKRIVYSTVRDGARTIWRMNFDGSNSVKLTNGTADVLPTLTPDDKWVLFTSLSGVQPQVFKVSIDGGEPQLVTDHRALGATVSPDGKWLAFAFAESPDPFAPANRLGLMPFDGPGELKTFEVRASGTLPIVLHWSNDSKSIIYSVTASNSSNLWKQPINGDKPEQITDFKEHLMSSFAWSPDGKTLACARGQLLRDAVLIRDTK